MIRITVHEEGSSEVKLKIEGRLVTRWVGELEAECRRHRAANKQVVLDFEDVTFIDGPGVRMLKRMRFDNVHIAHCSALILDLLDYEPMDED